MHPDIGILSLYIRSDSLSTIPDVPNTLTHQYSGTYNSPQVPAPQPRYMESCPDTARPYATYMYTSTVPDSPLTSWLPQELCHHISIRQISDASAAIVINISALSTVSDLILHKVFGLIWPNVFLVRLNSHLTFFDLRHGIQVLL